MPTHKVNNEIITAAIAGFESQKQHIDAQIAELRQMLSGGTAEPTAATEPVKPRRKMSAAARKRIAAAQRKRWAESKQQAEPAQPTPTAQPITPKRKISAAGKRAIAEATRKRWAKFRAEAAKAAKTQQAPAAKKFGKKAVAKKDPAKKSQAANAPQTAGTAQ